MQQRDCWVDWALLQSFGSECNTHEFAVQSEGKGSLVHIEAYAQHSFLLEAFAVLHSAGVGAVAQLTQSVVSIPEGMIAEGTVEVKIS